jgi:hypothetical protein
MVFIINVSKIEKNGPKTTKITYQNPDIDTKKKKKKKKKKAGAVAVAVPNIQKKTHPQYTDNTY